MCKIRFDLAARNLGFRRFGFRPVSAIWAPILESFCGNNGRYLGFGNFVGFPHFRQFILRISV
jgi:hypothetical protein